MTGLFCLAFGLIVGWWVEWRRREALAEEARWDEAKARAFAEAGDRLYDQREAAGHTANRLRAIVHRQNALLKRREIAT